MIPILTVLQPLIGIIPDGGIPHGGNPNENIRGKSKQQTGFVGETSFCHKSRPK